MRTRFSMRLLVMYGVPVVVSVLVALAVGGRVLLADDPPQITGVRIASTTKDTATIVWTTDKASDSQVNYGKQPHYGVAREPGTDKEQHTVTLEDLDASTIYHFRVSSVDELGNQAVSGDFVFTTPGFEEIKDIEKVESVEQKTLVGQAQDIVSRITDPDALELVQQGVTERAEDLLRPPAVIGLPRVINIEATEATVIWATSREANSAVSYGSEASYLATQSYSQTVGDPTVSTQSHEVRLTGLQPSTVYHFKVVSSDPYGLSGESSDDTFRTKSPLPTLEDVQIIKIEEDSATFAWSTDIPAAGAVEYTNTASGEIRSEGSPEFLTTQLVRLTDLTLGATYVAIVKAENEAGEAVESEPITFTTVRDVEPPLISRVTNESTLFPGAETRIQTILSWGTDEAAFCTLSYSEGLATAESARDLPKEDLPTTDHVKVLTEFLPSTVYKFWIACEDRSGNKSRTEDFVLFTPEKEKSIIDIILENFQGTFGWVKNVGK